MKFFKKSNDIVNDYCSVYNEFLNPFEEMFNTVFNEHNSVFKQEFGNDFFSNGKYPKVDIINYNDKVVIKSEIPGRSKDDVFIEVIGDTLVISGNKKESANFEDGYIVHKELKHSSFSRNFKLTNLDKDSINAKFENGILYITLKKLQPYLKQETVPKKIPIN